MRILLVELDNIGDAVMASFMPRCLKQMYTHSHVTVLTKEYTKDVFTDSPFVNEVIVFNPAWSGDQVNKSKASTWSQIRPLAKKLKPAKYDLAVVVNADWRKALITWLAKIRVRVGADKKRAGYFLSQKLAYKEERKKHAVEYNLDLLKKLGFKENKVELEVFINDETRSWAKDILEKNNFGPDDMLIGIHPGAGHPSRIWPAENYIKLINELQKDKFVKVMVLGSHADPAIKAIRDKINKYRAIFLGDISVKQMAALFQRCACVIAQDSGPMHLAVAAGTRVGAIFGPSNPWRFGPYGEGHIVIREELVCSPCGSDPNCQKLDCIKKVTVAKVIAAVKELLK